MRIALRALLVALLVATAGCSSLFGDAPASGPATTDTPTTVETASPVAGFGPPPGVTPGGLADTRALLDAHAAALANRSVTLRERRVRRYRNGSVRWRRNLTLRTAANRTRFLSVAETDGRPIYGSTESRVATFADGTGIYRSVETPDTSWTDVLRTATGDHETPRSLGLETARTEDLYVVLNAFATNDSASVRRTFGDPGRYRLESATVSHPDLLASRLGLAEVRNATMTAVVTAEGLVEEYRLTYAGTTAGSAGTATGVDVRGTVVLRYSAVGETTVETPGWRREMNGRRAGNLTATVR